ncbi:CHC2 zinc finger domain-containing protein [Roseibium salinum]|nr:CHC2 zinc finger domain-containing protein [Roseibium salinum]
MPVSPGKRARVFHVDDRRNRYKCFGCGASGDHFTFVCETEGLSFPEAVERLAEQAGVALPAPDPQAARREKKACRPRGDLRNGRAVLSGRICRAARGGGAGLCRKART